LNAPENGEQRTSEVARRRLFRVRSSRDATLPEIARLVGALARAADRCESVMIYVDGECETCGSPLLDLPGFDGQDPDGLDAAICDDMSKRFERNPHNAKK
jgi:hypothetical protein